MVRPRGLCKEEELGHGFGASRRASFEDQEDSIQVPERILEPPVRGWWKVWPGFEGRTWDIVHGAEEATPKRRRSKDWF